MTEATTTLTRAGGYWGYWRPAGIEPVALHTLKQSNFNPFLPSPIYPNTPINTPTVIG